MTFNEAQEKLEKVLKELEDDNFEVSSITKLLFKSETDITGSTIVNFNSDEIENKIIADYKEQVEYDKHRAANEEVF